MAYGVCDERLKGLAGLGVGARLARFLGLPESLAAAVRLQQRQRGCSDVRRLLALLSAACAGGGCLRAVDALGAERVARRACGLRAGPPSRRLGASLQRRHRAAREGLRECARLVSRRLTPRVARDCVRRWGYVPVCVDGPAIEVEGRLCEHAGRGDQGERQSWLHAVFVGPAWVSARLHTGGTDGKGEGREQLDRDVAPLLAAPQPVGLRAASAYSCLLQHSSPGMYTNKLLRISTHARTFRSPWTPSAAWNFIEQLLTSPGFEVLVAATRHGAVLAQTLAELPDFRGNVMHGMHTAALMRKHGVSRSCTRDTGFRRFPFLSVLGPLGE